MLDFKDTNPLRQLRRLVPLSRGFGRGTVALNPYDYSTNFRSWGFVPLTGGRDSNREAVLSEGVLVLHTLLLHQLLHTYLTAIAVKLNKVVTLCQRADIKTAATVKRVAAAVLTCSIVNGK